MGRRLETEAAVERIGFGIDGVGSSALHGRRVTRGTPSIGAARAGEVRARRGSRQPAPPRPPRRAPRRAHAPLAVVGRIALREIREELSWIASNRV